MFNLFNWISHWSGSTEKETHFSKEESDVKHISNIKKIILKNDLEFAYIDEGNPAGPVLLFIHGVGSGIPVWNKNIRTLKSNYRCIAVDLPGHGCSSKGDYSYSMSFYSDVMVEFINVMQLPPVTLIGHSMGGQIALLMGLHHQSLIEKLVVLSPSGIENYLPHETFFMVNAMSAVVFTGNGFTFNNFNHLLGFNHNLDQSGSLISKINFSKKDAFEFSRMMFGSVKAMLSQPVYPDLEKITLDCLLIVGNEDKVSPSNFLRPVSYADFATWIFQKVPKGKVVRVPLAGHFLQYQKPYVFNREVEIFLVPALDKVSA